MSPSAGPPHQPEQPIRNGGTGGPGGVKVVVAPGMSAPRPGTPLYIGVPFTISGSAIAGTVSEPDSGRVTRVTVTFDGGRGGPTHASGDWSSWSAAGNNPRPAAPTVTATAPRRAA